VLSIAALSLVSAKVAKESSFEMRLSARGRQAHTIRIIKNQEQKAAVFADLHTRPGIFVMPNPWDVGSALLLAALGFPALATSSAASAVASGKRDGQLTRDEALAHAQALVAATDLPVSADLENGFGDSPAEVAETVRLAAAAGLVGCTIEDAKREPSATPLYDRSFAAERIAAAAEIARKLPFPFLITARAHNFVFPDPSLADTLARLQAYEAAGADVLFAPGLPDIETVRTVCQSVSKPVNFMVGVAGKSFPLPDLEAAGVRRVSLATSLYRVAMKALLDASRSIQSTGTFDFLGNCPNTSELAALMKI
jgi:2-methylisocitrate lyase-like PEP mutase family enzyme